MFGEDFTAVDGFVNVHQSLEEMMRYAANEPSVGLHFVQRHARDAMPNLIRVKDKLAGATRETVLHTQDLEDSINALACMSRCGPPIAEDMIKDIAATLRVVSASTGPRRGFIHNLGSMDTPQNVRSGRSYISSVLRSAKQKATNLRWSQLDFISEQSEHEEPPYLSAKPLSSVCLPNPSCSPQNLAEEMPISSHVPDYPFEEGMATGSSTSRGSLSTTESYKLFTSEKEEKLEKWLQEFDESPKAS